MQSSRRYSTWLEFLTFSWYNERHENEDDQSLNGMMQKMFYCSVVLSTFCSVYIFFYVIILSTTHTTYLVFFSLVSKRMKCREVEHCHGSSRWTFKVHYGVKRSIIDIQKFEPTKNHINSFTLLFFFFFIPPKV